VANNISFIIELQNRFSREAEKIRASVRRATAGFDKFNRKIKKASIKLIRLGRKAKEAGKGLAELGKKLTKSITLPLSILGGVALVQSAKLETLAVAFETMTGSAAKGKKLLEDLTQFTATTPFQLEGVGKAAKTLLAFKVSVDDMTPTLRMLGDIAAGTSAPLSDIALIFGKARAKGKLMTEEILQLAERGIPVIDVLAEKLKVTKPAIFKLASESKISFAVMEDALRSMTTTGGIFFDQTRKQSETLGGVWSTLKDNIALTAAVFGDILVDVFGLKAGISGVSEFLTTLRTRIKAFAREHPVLTKILVILTAIIAVIGPLLVVVGTAVIGFGALSIAAGFLGISLGAVAAPVLIVVAAIAAIVTAGVLLVRHWETIKMKAKELWEKVKKNFLIIAILLPPIALLIAAGSLIVRNWDKIKMAAAALWEAVKKFFGFIVDLISGFGAKAFDFLLAAFVQLIQLFTGVETTADSVFSSMVDSVIEFGKNVVDFAIGPITKVVDMFSNLNDAVSSFVFGDDEEKKVKAVVDIAPKIEKVKAAVAAAIIAAPPAEIETPQAGTLRSQTDINVNLRAPEKVIESTRARSSGNQKGLSVGMNVVTGGA